MDEQSNQGTPAPKLAFGLAEVVNRLGRRPIAGDPFQPTVNEAKHFVDRFLDAVLDAPPSIREEAARHLNDGGAGPLMFAVEDLAASAVRTGDHQHLVRAALAVALASQASSDFRDVLLVTALPWDAAQRLHLDPAILYEEVAEVSPQHGAQFLRDWVHRPSELQSLQAMRFEAREDEPGFRYVRVPWPPPNRPVNTKT